MSRFTTIKGVKRAAKKFARETGMPHMAALEEIARREGFQSYKHLKTVLETEEAKYMITVQASWFKPKMRDGGLEKIQFPMKQPLRDLVKAHHLKGYLRGAKPENEALLADFHHYDAQDRAREIVCSRARALQFMEATGLKPSSSNTRAYPNGDWRNQPPGSDHERVWYDPETKGYVLTYEPYEGSELAHFETRETWAQANSCDIAKSGWGSIYSNHTELYLVANHSSKPRLEDLLRKLDAAPSPIFLKDWNRYVIP